MPTRTYQGAARILCAFPARTGLAQSTVTHSEKRFAGDIPPRHGKRQTPSDACQILIRLVPKPICNRLRPLLASPATEVQKTEHQ